MEHIEFSCLPGELSCIIWNLFVSLEPPCKYVQSTHLIRDAQKVCPKSIAYLDRTHREGFTKALYRCYGKDMRLIAKSIVQDIHVDNEEMFQAESRLDSIPLWM